MVGEYLSQGQGTHLADSHACTGCHITGCVRPLVFPRLFKQGLYLLQGEGSLSRTLSDKRFYGLGRVAFYLFLKHRLVEHLPENKEGIIGRLVGNARLLGKVQKPLLNHVGRELGKFHISEIRTDVIIKFLLILACYFHGEVTATGNLALDDRTALIVPEVLAVLSDGLSDVLLVPVLHARNQRAVAFTLKDYLFCLRLSHTSCGECVPFEVFIIDPVVPRQAFFFLEKFPPEGLFCHTAHKNTPLHCIGLLFLFCFFRLSV